MYYKLDNDELERINRVSKITFTDYELKGNFISVESMMAAIEDLLIEIDRLEETKKDIEQDIENNYELKNIDPYEEYGISEEDFYLRF